jgi:hypothetical protein
MYLVLCLGYVSWKFLVQKQQFTLTELHEKIYVLGICN